MWKKQIENQKYNLKIGDTLYYAQIMISLGLYEVIELKVRTIAELEDGSDSYFCGIDVKDERAYVFNFEDLENIVFRDRDKCLFLVNQTEYEHKDDIISTETYYEDY